MPTCNISPSGHCQYHDLDYDNICMYCKTPLSEHKARVIKLAALILWIRERLLRLDK